MRTTFDILGAAVTAAHASVPRTELRPQRPLPAGRRTHRDDPGGHVGYTPPRLLDFARQIASDRGSLGDLALEGVTERTYRLLSRDDVVEAWLIAWPPGGRLDLHDHGISSGAFFVVEGELEEFYSRRLCPLTVFRRRLHPVGSGVGFRGRYVHDVRNPGTANALSVHVYSPPLEAMTFYRRDRTDVLPERTEYRGGDGWER